MKNMKVLLLTLATIGSVVGEFGNPVSSFAATNDQGNVILPIIQPTVTVKGEVEVRGGCAKHFVGNKQVIPFLRTTFCRVRLKDYVRKNAKGKALCTCTTKTKKIRNVCLSSSFSTGEDVLVNRFAVKRIHYALYSETLNPRIFDRKLLSEGKTFLSGKRLIVKISKYKLIRLVTKGKLLDRKGTALSRSSSAFSCTAA